VTAASCNEFLSLCVKSAHCCPDDLALKVESKYALSVGLYFFNLPMTEAITENHEPEMMTYVVNTAVDPAGSEVYSAG
jgi:hypothetical protein